MLYYIIRANLNEGELYSQITFPSLYLSMCKEHYKCWDVLAGRRLNF